MKQVIITLILLCLSACASTSELATGHAQNLKNHNSFGVCYGYGCKHYQKTGLSDDEWQSVRDIFIPAAKTPAEERARIAKAIARIEQYVGPKTGTDADKARAIVINFSTRTQMDCVDEAFNSTSYLYLMRQDGLIRHHILGSMLRRNLAELSYPHSTATIHEIGIEKTIEGAGHYAVDSWFHENGALAEVLPAEVWKDRWYPSEKRYRYNFSPL